MNLPNSLTLARIVLVPLLVVVLLTKFEGHQVSRPAQGLSARAHLHVASLTDWLDGYLARRRQQVTILGQLLDPIADKLLITAALVSLVQLSLAPAWMVAIIIGRELAVTGLRGVAQTRGLVMPASRLGKLKMVAQVVAILAAHARAGSGRRARAAGIVLSGDAALWIVLALALWSAVEYYQTFAAVVGGPTPRGRAEPLRLAAAGRRRGSDGGALKRRPVPAGRAGRWPPVAGGTLELGDPLLRLFE